jgi:hypothetical protein
MASSSTTKIYHTDVSDRYIEEANRTALRDGQVERYAGRAMSFRPNGLQGDPTLGRVVGHVDYRLARNAIVSEFRKGRLSRLDVCDAQPELLRAAINMAEDSREDCPICEEAKVRLVSYVFGSRLPPSGRCVTSKGEMLKLSRSGGGRDLACYVVEVCPNCSWNHLAQSFPVSGRRATG